MYKECSTSLVQCCSVHLCKKLIQKVSAGNQTRVHCFKSKQPTPMPRLNCSLKGKNPKSVAVNTQHTVLNKSQLIIQLSMISFR